MRAPGRAVWISVAMVVAGCGRTEIFGDRLIGAAGGSGVGGGGAAATGGGFSGLGGGAAGGGAAGGPVCGITRQACTAGLKRLDGVVQDIDRGTNAFGVELAHDARANLVLGYQFSSATGESVGQVLRSGDGGFDVLGSPADPGLQPTLALVSGVPHLAWSELTLSPRPIVARRTCAGWEKLPPVPVTTLGFAPRVAGSASGALFVATTDEQDATKVARWDGDEWALLGGALTGKHDPDLTVDATGPVVSVTSGASIEVLRWDGSGWNPLGTFPGSTVQASSSRIATDPAGRLVVAWLDLKDAHWRIRCARLLGQVWRELGSAQQPTLGSAFQRPAIAFGPDAEPWLAWRQFINVDNTDIRSSIWVSRWTSAMWLIEVPGLTARSNASLTSVALAIDRKGDPVVAWEELDGMSYRVELWTKTGCVP